MSVSASDLFRTNRSKNQQKSSPELRGPRDRHVPKLFQQDQGDRPIIGTPTRRSQRDVVTFVEERWTRGLNTQGVRSLRIPWG